MFKQVSGIWPKGKVYTITCGLQGLDGEKELIAAREACSLKANDLSWSVPRAALGYWLAAWSEEGYPSKAEIRATNRAKIGAFRDYLILHGWIHDKDLRADDVDGNL